jgi:hypothetical protein
MAEEMVDKVAELLKLEVVLAESDMQIPAEQIPCSPPLPIGHATPQAPQLNGSFGKL